MKKSKNKLCIAACLLLAFALWTAALCFVDVQPMGPCASNIGFAQLNGFVHSLTGVHMGLYFVTDWLSLLPLAFVLLFAMTGLVQWVKRKSLSMVDRSIIVLGVFYIAVMAAYLLFERLVINYRPVLMDGLLEASYPSSTTMLVLCVMLTAVMQLKKRIKNIKLGKVVTCAMLAFTAFMVIARLYSGVHWFSDIVGGVLLSLGLVMLYGAFSQ